MYVFLLHSATPRRIFVSSLKVEMRQTTFSKEYVACLEMGVGITYSVDKLDSTATPESSIPDKKSCDWAVYYNSVKPRYDRQSAQHVGRYLHASVRSLSH